MNNFLLVFRMDQSPVATRTPEQGQAVMQQWMDWLAGIAAKDRLVDNGSRLEATGAVVKPGNVVTNGPYADIKETIGGYSIIKAGSLEEAIELSKNCPVLMVGGNVEVRQIAKM